MNKSPISITIDGAEYTLDPSAALKSGCLTRNKRKLKITDIPNGAVCRAIHKVCETIYIDDFLMIDNKKMERGQAMRISNTINNSVYPVHGKFTWWDEDCDGVEFSYFDVKKMVWVTEV